MKIAFLFSGQGAQFPGMFEDLYNCEESVRAVFTAADRSLGRDIAQICFKGTQEELNLTHNTQPCVLAADIAAGNALIAHGVRPQAVAGFSLGEYAALVCSGAMELERAFEIIQIRADAMQAAVPAGQGAMAAVIGVDSATVEQVCAQITDAYVIPANYNSPVQTVISGTVEGVDKACEIFGTMNIRTMKLAVSAPFHCALMEPAAQTLGKALSAGDFAAPQVPYYANVDAKAHFNAGEIPELLVRQAMSPVRWQETLEHLFEDGFDTFIECGPGKTLSGLVRKTLKGVSIYRVGDAKSLNATLEALAKDEN